MILIEFVFLAVSASLLLLYGYTVYATSKGKTFESKSSPLSANDSADDQVKTVEVDPVNPGENTTIPPQRVKTEALFASILAVVVSIVVYFVVIGTWNIQAIPAHYVALSLACIVMLFGLGYVYYIDTEGGKLALVVASIVMVLLPVIMILPLILPVKDSDHRSNEGTSQKESSSTKSSTPTTTTEKSYFEQIVE